MNSKIILLDVDGVLADFTSAVLQWGNAITGLDKRLADVTFYGQLFELYPEEFRHKIEQIVSSEGFCSKLEVYKGAKDGVAKLRELGRVYAVTSPWHSKTWCFERAWWLKAHFGMKDWDVIHAREKHLVRGDMLVEDHPVKLAMWQGVNQEGLALLVDMPYNQGTDPALQRVHTWNEIVAAAKGHFDG
jgi:5'(3')-deoxyribonucleotidase